MPYLDIKIPVTIFFAILPPRKQNEILEIRWESVTELAIFEGITYRNITVKLPITFTAHIFNSEYSLDFLTKTASSVRKQI